MLPDLYRRRILLPFSKPIRMDLETVFFFVCFFFGWVGVAQSFWILCVYVWLGEPAPWWRHTAILHPAPWTAHMWVCVTAESRKGCINSFKSQKQKKKSHLNTEILSIRGAKRYFNGICPVWSQNNILSKTDFSSSCNLLRAAGGKLCKSGFYLWATKDLRGLSTMWTRPPSH